MDPSVEVKPVEGNNKDEYKDRYITAEEFHNTINAFRAEMRSMFAATNAKIEDDVKTLRDEVSDLRAKSRELEGLILDQDARSDTIVEGNRLTQSGNTNNIRRITAPTEIVQAACSYMTWFFSS